MNDALGLTASEMGKLGAAARLAKLSPERTKEIAAKATAASVLAAKKRRREWHLSEYQRLGKELGLYD